MSIAASTSSPSGFATLLRRSKFASFDPAIHQSYTATAAHRARGQWGFKRSTPTGSAASKRKYIAVSAADTPQNQMEWESAEAEVRWDRRWQEIGRMTDSYEGSDWSNNVILKNLSRTWAGDSEFDPGAGETDLDLHLGQAKDMGYVPNIAKMGAKRFEKYLDELRRLRPQVKEYLMKKAEQEEQRLKKAAQSSVDSKKPKRTVHVDKPHDISLYAYGQEDSAQTIHIQYLRERPPGDAHSRLTPTPHANGGLSYTRPSELQTHLTHSSVPGRLFGKMNSSHGNYALTGIAGQVGRLVESLSEGRTATDLNRMSDDDDRGKANFRITDAQLAEAPPVVGARLGIEGIRMETKVRVVDAAERNRRNPHRPGTMEYVAHEDKGANRPVAAMEPMSMTNTLLRRSSAPEGGERKVDHTHLVQTLEVLLEAQAGKPDSRGR